MKEIRALLNMAGSFIWQSDYQGEEEGKRQQGVRVTFQSSSLLPDSALIHLAETLADLEEEWIHPLGSPDGPWVIHLEQMAKSFDSLSGQTWMVGDREIVPTFDIYESTVGGGQPKRIGLVCFTIGRSKAKMHVSVPHFSDIQSSLEAFRVDYPDPARCGFLMMAFSESRLHQEIVQAVKLACGEVGVKALRADDHRYSDDLLPNIRTYMHGCSFGIAVFERLRSEDFNPNVSLEVGYMMALGKPVCLLRDSTLRTLQSDLVGRVYDTFDVQDIAGTVPVALKRWLQTKRLIPSL